ncbi:hypothetical protein [Bifidobacterium callitrichidarum]|uniref:hypothetical protein n=1 Tax=Bifidobacterium callitrichidarum TaxID=2052941 RepID=UPI001304F11D|nr:hypothetical protein [Bifidobacterium callitrichidarum]
MLNTFLVAVAQRSATLKRSAAKSRLGIPTKYGIGIDWNDFRTRVEWQSND